MTPRTDGWDPNEWNRWRGALDQKVHTMSVQLTTVVDWVKTQSVTRAEEAGADSEQRSKLNTLVEWADAQRLADAEEAGVRAEQRVKLDRRARFRGWLVPNFPQVATTIAAVIALVLASMGIHLL